MMTRKRAVKLLMARGHSRNLANSFMRHKRDGTSNLSMYQLYLSFNRIANRSINFFTQVSNLCCAYGVGPDEIFNPWPPRSAMSIEPMMQI